MVATTDRPDLDPVTLHTLIRRKDLGLRMALPESDLPASALRTELRWMHSSDLLDPSPFLATGLMLLTTGAQLPLENPAEVSAYVSRLAACGVIAIGFGTGVVHDHMPGPLVQACREHRVPLLEVPYEVPFIAVTRAAADAVAAHDYAWRTWELKAHRQLAAAALRPDPLGAALAELGKQLDCWVGLFDASGRPSRNHPRALPGSTASALRARVQQVLDRGSRAAVSVHLDERTFQIQTLGRGGLLRGMLALETAALNREGQGLVSSFVAMAEIAGESTKSLGGARARLRSVILASLLSGDIALAEQVAELAWGGLPPEPVRVAVTRPGPHVQRVQAFVDLHVDPMRCLAGESGEVAAVVLAAQDSDLLGDIASRFGGRYGVSRPTSYANLTTAVRHALAARDRGAGPLVAVEDVSARGVLATIGPAGVEAAHLVLDPILRHDAAHGSDLMRTVRVWLEHDAEHAAAATALGVHRHTVRSRIALIGSLLNRDLATFPARADLWAALVATDQD